MAAKDFCDRMNVAKYFYDFFCTACVH